MHMGMSQRTSVEFGGGIWRGHCIMLSGGGRCEYDDWAFAWSASFIPPGVVADAHEENVNGDVEWISIGTRLRARVSRIRSVV